MGRITRRCTAHTVALFASCHRGELTSGAVTLALTATTPASLLPLPRTRWNNMSVDSRHVPSRRGRKTYFRQRAGSSHSCERLRRPSGFPAASFITAFFFLSLLCFFAPCLIPLADNVRCGGSPSPVTSSSTSAPTPRSVLTVLR